jgi:hypothetical protein
MGEWRRAAVAAVLALVVCAIAASQVSAAEHGPATIIEEPGYTGPLSISVFGSLNAHSVTVGHWFTFGYLDNKCGQRSKTIADVELVERPKTKARPFKSAVIYATANYGPQKREIGADGVEYEIACPAIAEVSLEKVKTKRPAKNLIFYDGSVEPPRRIWPPVETPPER